MEWMPGPYLSWTPDNRSLILPNRTAADKPVALFVFPVQVGERRQLTFPPDGTLGDACAALAPDGRTLAFCRCSHLGGWVIDLYTVALGANLTPRDEVKVPERFARLNGLAWNPQGSELIVGVDDNGQSLVRLKVPNRFGRPTTALQVGEAGWPTTARRSPRLAFSRLSGGGEAIWRLKIPAHGKALEPPAALISSTRSDFAPRYSPDGRGSHLNRRAAATWRYGRATAQVKNACSSLRLAVNTPASPPGHPMGRSLLCTRGCIVQIPDFCRRGGRHQFAAGYIRR